MDTTWSISLQKKKKYRKTAIKIRLDLLFLSREGKSTMGEWKFKKQYDKSIWGFLISGKLQSWNGLLLPVCHLTTESVQGKAGFPTGRIPSNLCIKIFNA